MALINPDHKISKAKFFNYSNAFLIERTLLVLGLRARFFVATLNTDLKTYALIWLHERTRFGVFKYSIKMSGPIFNHVLFRDLARPLVTYY